LIYGPNENGKTFLVEFIIRSLFRQAQQWHLRDHEGSGKVSLTGLKESLIEFSPAVDRRIEDFWEESHPGLPADFSRLLVVKGAEVDIAESNGGIDKQILKRLLSNKAILDLVQKKISKTIQESTLQNGVIMGPKRGDINQRTGLETSLKKYRKLFDQIDHVYATSHRNALKGRLRELGDQRGRLLLAKRYQAHLLCTAIKKIEALLRQCPGEEVEKLRAEVTQVRKLGNQLAEKREWQREAALASQHYEWLKNASQLYQHYLSEETNPPSGFLLVIGLLAIVAAGTLSFFALPLFSALALAILLLVAGLYFKKSKARLAKAIQNEEIAALRAVFQEKMGSALTGLPSILAALEKMEEAYNNSRLLRKQLIQDVAEMRTAKSGISDGFDRLIGHRPPSDNWLAALGKLDDEIRSHQAQLRDKELALAQLNVDVSDYVKADPGVRFSKQRLDEVEKQIEETQAAIDEENRKLDSLKQIVTQVTNDDISCQWDDVITHLKDVYQQTLADYRKKTAEILGKIALCEVLQELRTDEDSKIVEGLKSPYVQAPIYQLTKRYKSVDLQGERLKVADRFNDFDIADLSTGAQEQIMLALRIGFSTKMMHGEPLFLILDDAFQYSDWRRRKLLVDKMSELARNGWQIIYFSMDDNIRTLFDRKGKEFGEDYKFINLTQPKRTSHQLDILSQN